MSPVRLVFLEQDNGEEGNTVLKTTFAYDDTDRIVIVEKDGKPDIDERVSYERFERTFLLDRD